jgi:hypothetical protein
LPALLARWQERLAVLGEAADIAGLAARAAARASTTKNWRSALSGSAPGRRALGGEVSQVMQQLALGGGRFEVGLLPVEGGNAAGLEQIEFRIAGLAGSEPRSLAKVASGGEISRISLAIQVVTSQAASVPTLIFDEVDVGIGGGVAEVVGRLLRELGAERQVLCVTHLPQVAARANWQWQVSKVADAGQLRSQVATLDAEARVEEIARMLGGIEITAITRQHARKCWGFPDRAGPAEERRLRKRSSSLDGLCINFTAVKRRCTSGLLELALGSLPEGLEEFRVFRLEVFDDLEVFALEALNVDLLDMHEAQQLTHRLGHVAAAFIARTAALRHADL